MSDFQDHDLERSYGRPGRYELHGEPRSGIGWIGIVAAAILLFILALAFFGGSAGDTTTEIHPGGAGAPPVAIRDSAAQPAATPQRAD